MLSSHHATQHTASARSTARTWLAACPPAMLRVPVLWGCWQGATIAASQAWPRGVSARATAIVTARATATVTARAAATVTARAAALGRLL